MKFALAFAIQFVVVLGCAASRCDLAEHMTADVQSRPSNEVGYEIEAQSPVRSGAAVGVRGRVIGKQGQFWWIEYHMKDICTRSTEWLGQRSRYEVQHLVVQPVGATTKSVSTKYTVRDAENHWRKLGHSPLVFDDVRVPLSAGTLPPEPLRWMLSSDRDSRQGSVMPDVGQPNSSGVFNLEFSVADCLWASLEQVPELELALSFRTATTKQRIAPEFFRD